MGGTIKSNQDAVQDGNFFPALLAHSGTAGTATTVRLTADANGNLGIAGTVVSAIALNSGTITTILAGTQNTLGTVGVLNSGSIVVTIGTVSVVTPGVGATNLGKAIDSAIGATDTGVLMLAKHTNEDNFLTSAEGDYDTLHVDSRGALHANPEQHVTFDALDATAGWSALGNDTLNLATTLKHLTSTLALTFDKVNGAANTVFAGIQKTITAVNLGNLALHDLVQSSFYIPDITNVAYVFLRLGTDSSNYNEWQVVDTSITAATFLVSSLAIGDANYAGITGNGWDPSVITYVAVGVAFDNQTNTLAGIVFDEVSYHTNLHTSAAFSTEVTSDVNTPNVNINKVGGSSTATNAGANSNGVLRVTVATDDEINDDLDAIRTATETIDNAISGNEMQVDVVSGTLTNLATGTVTVGVGTVTTGSLTNVATLGTILNVDKGTITSLQGGTLTNLATGSVVVTAGTTIVSTGTVTVGVGTITTGSLTNVATAGTLLNLDKGTVTSLQGGTLTNLATGTVTVGLGTVLVTNGTILQSAGTLTTGSLTNVANLGTMAILTAGTITNVASGSMVQTVGTVTTGSLTNVATLGTILNLNTGTIAVVAAGSHVHTAGTVTTGSLTNVATTGTLLNLDKGTITSLQGGTLGNLVSGTVTVGIGTVTTGSLTNLATLGTILNLNTGTLAIVTAGTITALGLGTISAGTFRENWRPVGIGSTFGTLAVAAGSAFGTLVEASGAGTVVVVAGCSIVCQSGTPDVRILIGTLITGGSVLTGGAFVPGGGIARNFSPPHETPTNSEITYHFVNAGTAFITVQYWNIP